MFNEDIDAFIADFGVTAVFGAETRNVLVDLPDQIMAGDYVITGKYQITYKTGYFPTLTYSSPITVNGIAYTVDTVTAVEDGALTVASLSKT